MNWGISTKMSTAMYRQSEENMKRMVEVTKKDQSGLVAT